MKRKSLCIASFFLLLVVSSPVWAETPWAWKPKTLELHGNDITFEWAVPKLQRAPGDITHWQKLLDNKMKEELNEFQSAFEDAQRENLESAGDNNAYQPTWESTGGYQVVWQDPQHLVLLWQGYDFRGGAHGLPVIEVTVLDAGQPDSLLPPTSLFSDQTAVLDALSTTTRLGLSEQFVDPLDDWAIKGTEPKWENFQIVYPSYLNGPARFEVIFPSYQVAPYSAGTPTVTLPWEALSSWTPALKDGVQLP